MKPLSGLLMDIKRMWNQFWKEQILLFIFLSVLIGCGNTPKDHPAPETHDIQIDAQKDGVVYGDLTGLKRVEQLEQSLRAMRVRYDHPRVFLTEDKLKEVRKRVGPFNPHWQEVLKNAEKGSFIDAAFTYAVLADVDPKGSALALNIAKKALLELEPDTSKGWQEEMKAAMMCLAYDWIYNGLTPNERNILAIKLAHLNEIQENALKIKNGSKANNETFHREEWIFHSWKTWPEVALAHHVPNAESNYLNRWQYDWTLGDAARMYAYAADGSPFEGYYLGADGCDWFEILKTSTGVNLVDDPQIGWCRGAAYYMLYRLDFGTGREVLHKGVNIGGGGLLSYTDGETAWKLKAFLGRSFAYAADDPYVQWAIENVSKGISSWTMGMTGYKSIPELNGIAQFLYDSPFHAAKSLEDVRYEDFPYARFFPGGREAYMRTSFSPASTIVGFTARPAYTMTSHSDFEVNTFMIYKQGNLAPDSGFYDAYVGQKNYLKYQKNTTAHNNIVVIDPGRPDEPMKLSGRTPDPGGVERIFTRSFGKLWRFGLEDTFLHNPRADWSRILDFKTTKAYDYIIGEAAGAYYTRLDEYIRTLVFIRKGDNAYIIVFDRLEAKKDHYIKKWLLHTVTKPDINGEIVKTKFKGHHETFDGDFLVANNVYDNAKLYCKTLLPRHRELRRIGGEGFEFYVEGSKPKNWPVPDETKKRIEKQISGPWQEVGTWRVEVVAKDKKKRDYFLNVLYTAGVNDSLRAEDITMTETEREVTVHITDTRLGLMNITLPKVGTPTVEVQTEAK